jgi:hypothetical protein
MVNAMAMPGPLENPRARFTRTVAFYKRGDPIGSVLWCVDCVGTRAFTDPDEWDVRKNYTSSSHALYTCRICGKTNRKEPT